MTTEAPQPTGAGTPSVSEVFEHLKVPTGFRAELLRGEIILSPTRIDRHNRWFWSLAAQLAATAVANGWSVTNTQTLSLPATSEEVVPDLIVIPQAAMDAGEWRKRPDEVLLVCEITSPSTRERDLEDKSHSYAASDIPVYLVVDLYDNHGEGTVTVYSEPDGKGAYIEHQKVAFGKPIALPDPIGVEVDTSRFTARTRKS